MSLISTLPGTFSCFFLFIFLIVPTPSPGEILTIDEDFSTTTDRDSLMTTAVWDTTSLRIHLHPQILFPRGALNTTSAYWSARSDDYLFVADGVSGLRSISIADPNIPVEMDLVDCTDQAKSVAISGDHAYVAGGTAGLQVIDISDPAAMIDGGYFTNGGDLQYVSSATVSGSALYLAESGAGVAIFNISDPALPIFVRHMPTGTWTFDVFSNNNHLFVLDGGLKIFDLSNPYDPTEISFTTLTGTGLRVSVAGTRAFVASGSSGLQILDISDLANPLPLTTFGDWTSCKYAAATTTGDTVFVAAGDQGLYVLDATDSEHIQTMGIFDTISSAMHILYAGDMIHTCVSSDGLKLHEIDPDGLDPLNNRAQTINLNDTDDPVSSVRLSAAVSDSVVFQVTANGGAAWHDIESGADWFEFPTAGTDVRWRANLFDTGIGVEGGPACGSVSLSMDRLASFADITSVSDVPDDSGLQVRLSWLPSRHDAAGADYQVTEYSIYRRYAEGSAKAVVPGIPYPPGQWDFVTTIPADMESQYAAVVPTLADSNHAGVTWAVFFVRTRTTQVGVFFDSPPDSGFSVNNLQPDPPTGVVADYSPPSGTQLSWDPSMEPRFAHFRIYRSVDPHMPVQPATLYAITTETEFFDETNTQYYYKITQMTLDGQESDPAGELSAVSEICSNLQLLPNTPNPFNPLTEISFLVDGSLEPVSLIIFDSRGRKIRQLLAQPLAEGWHTAAWNGRDDAGRNCASGLYHARLRQGPNQRVMKMTLIR